MAVAVSPMMADLRRSLEAMGVPFEADDSEEVIDPWGGFIQHYESTRTAFGTARYSWTRDEDNVKAWQTALGWLGYVEVDASGVVKACDREEAASMMSGNV